MIKTLTVTFAINAIVFVSSLFMAISAQLNMMAINTCLISGMIMMFTCFALIVFDLCQ